MHALRYRDRTSVSALAPRLQFRCATVVAALGSRFTAHPVFARNGHRPGVTPAGVRRRAGTAAVRRWKPRCAVVAAIAPLLIRYRRTAPCGSASASRLPFPPAVAANEIGRAVRRTRAVVYGLEGAMHPLRHRGRATMVTLTPALRFRCAPVVAGLGSRFTPHPVSARNGHRPGVTIGRVRRRAGTAAVRRWKPRRAVVTTVAPLLIRYRRTAGRGSTSASRLALSS